MKSTAKIPNKQKLPPKITANKKMTRDKNSDISKRLKAPGLIVTSEK